MISVNKQSAPRDPFSGGNPEREPVDGGDIPRLWSEEVVKARSDSSGPWAAHAKGFREPLKLDGRFWVHGDAPLCRPAEAPENAKRPFRNLRKGVGWMLTQCSSGFKREMWGADPQP